ncbi:MAG: polyketide cyclase [Paraburkholderia sp.]|uniref:SRPBCC family protein n=1 Tax=Paraburkholderia sp. TaxID=1926495 RepID=UPI001216361C|nr:SRPBCC family protein [Paraburkholderia sp.]TAM02315.1 MAG: polyketide cyclase [Paraburkholderia sp.]TAM30592.1 MAG: polyketide cyclase [Paraburkholderia sp.]
MATHTIRLHRVLRCPPERLYRAFLDPDALVKWLAPNGFVATVHQLEAKVGGRYRMSFRNFATSEKHSFSGEYLELVPNAQIRYSGVFDNPNLPGAMETTVVLQEVFCGTEVSVVQRGVPEVIPAEACYLGWQESLLLLGLLVEAEIKG